MQPHAGGAGTTMIGPHVSRAYMTSCAPRREVREETLTRWRATDWDAEVTVVLDRGRFDFGPTRVTDTSRELLLLAVHEGAELVLHVEDDVDPNAWLRHNLTHWQPVIDHRPGDLLFATLYNPNIARQASAEDPAPFVTTDPELVYGSQAFLFSRAAAIHVLDHWHEANHPIDLKAPRLLGLHTPIWVHRPSLVEHRTVHSTWGGAVHHAVDFVPDWRAPD